MHYNVIPSQVQEGLMVFSDDLQALSEDHQIFTNVRPNSRETE